MFTQSCGEVKRRLDRRLIQRLPTIDPAHGDLPRRHQRPEQHGRRFRVGQRALSLNTALELPVQTFDGVGGPQGFPLRSRIAHRGRSRFRKWTRHPAIPVDRPSATQAFLWLLRLRQYRACLIHHAETRLFLRYVKSNILLVTLLVSLLGRLFALATPHYRLGRVTAGITLCIRHLAMYKTSCRRLRICSTAKARPAIPPGHSMTGLDTGATITARTGS